MTDFTRDGDSDRRSISRRRFVSTTAAAGVLATGRTAAQNDDDGGGGDGGGSAVNVGTTDTIENADEVRFDEAIPVGELAQLFIEFDTADHPVIGTDIQFQGSSSMRWPRTRSEPPSPPISSGTSSSGRRSHTSPLFEPMAWVSGGDVSLESSFYDEYQLVRLAGTADADQRFFDRYGSVPYVWGVVPATESVQPGTVVDVTGTVEYAGRDDSTVEFGASGVYLTVTGLVDRGQRTTISASTSSGDHASFLGTQLRTQPQLTTGLADLEYSYETEFPRPAGGSIVTHEGQVDSTDYESGGVDTASMRTTGQRIVVGETRGTVGSRKRRQRRFRGARVSQHRRGTGHVGKYGPAGHRLGRLPNSGGQAKRPIARQLRRERQQTRHRRFRLSGNDDLVTRVTR